MRLIKYYIFNILILIFSNWAFALDLTSPFALETSQVLPKGIGNPHFADLFMSIDTKYGGSGGYEPLGYLLNRTVSWNSVISSQNTAVDRSLVQSTVKDSGVDSNGSPGSTTGQVNAFFDVKVPILAFGITDKFTLAVALPVMSVSVAADTGFARSADGQTWVNKLCTLSVEQCNQAASQLNNAINQRMALYGYQPIQSRSFSAVGDMQLVGKYLLYQDEKNGVGLKTTVVVPTGRGPNADIAVDIPTGDGRFEIGQAVTYDRILLSNLRWNSYLGYMALLPTRLDRRIPLTSDDPISPDKESLTKNLGSMATAGTSFQYEIPRYGVRTGLGYSYQFLSKTTYSQGVYSPERYSYLENFTPSESLHSAIFLAGLSTVDWYMNKKFFYPFQANFVYSHPLLGRNVTTNDVVAGEIVLFF